MIYETPNKQRIIKKKVSEGSNGKNYYSIEVLSNGSYLVLNVAEPVFDSIKEGFQYTLVLEHTTYYDTVNNRVVQRLRVVDVY